VLQETLLQAYQAISHFTWRDEPSFVRWLQAIAENRIRDAVKGPRGAEVLQLPTDAKAEVVSPSRHAQRDERFDRLQRAIQRLNPDHRKVILLSRIEGLKVKEISRRMNRSESAVKSLLVRALRELKSSFGDTESLHLPDRHLGSHGWNRDE
jgi:RNA polymerase sigma-70 factor (ECF subfamily)